MCDLEPKCRFPAGRTCPTHSLTPEQRQQRSAAAAASHKKRDPEGYAAQRSAAGAEGYKATLKKYGPIYMKRLLDRYRKNHPSQPETKVMEVLTEYQVPYEFQGYVQETIGPIDFILTRHQPLAAIVEIDGWRRLQVPFGRKNTSNAWQELLARMQYLEGRGYPTLILEGEPECWPASEQKLLTFLKEHY